MNYEKFEDYWLQHRNELLKKNAEYCKIKESYKMQSGFDWLLWALPLVAGIVTFNILPIMSEMFKWILSAVIVIAVFVICVWVKSATSGLRSLYDVEKEVKRQAYEKYKNDKELKK